MSKNKFFKILEKNTTNFLGVIVLLVTAWVGYFIYLPAHKKLVQFNKDISEVNAQIERIEAIKDPSKTWEQMLVSLQERDRYLTSKLPAKEEGSLNALMVLAQEAKVEYLSTNLQPKQICQDKDGQPLIIHDKMCREVSVSITIKGPFRNVVHYIRLLYEKLPVFMEVQSLHLKNNDSAQQLDVSIDFMIFTVS